MYVNELLHENLFYDIIMNLIRGMYINVCQWIKYIKWRLQSDNELIIINEYYYKEMNLRQKVNINSTKMNY